ncbi:MAG: sulfate/thiosulfate transport system permease protein [Gaiellales bacterium]|nr:sulfate/thiosulfate transport system permease protein [Gaiellales bacterium]
MAAADATLSAPPVPRAKPGGTRFVPLGFGLLAGTYASALILLPLAALVWKAQGLGLSGIWDAVSASDARSAFELTIACSLIVVIVNAIFGTMLAWVLERDQFFGKRFVNAVIDLPFALPTIVAGLTLIALYGQRSPVGINIAYTRTAIVVALAFVTLPFVVRSVQPVLRELDREAEQAAMSLGASPFVTFRRVILPALVPAIASGCSLAFAKAVGEFGSVVLISGNIPLKTQVASVAIFGHLEPGDTKGATALAVVLLAISLGMLLLIGVFERIARRHED